MKRTLLSVGLALALMVSAATAQDFDKGLAAAQAGDYATALQEWLPLAEQGNDRAQFNLGIMYENSNGVPQDYAEAVKWFRLAAEQGLAEAQYNLGVMYRNGNGVPQDFTEAVNWYQMAATQGEPRAQDKLGLMYFNGRGVPQDFITAYMWLNLATENGASDGQAKRDGVAVLLTPADLSEAQRRASVCLESNYENCD